MAVSFYGYVSEGSGQWSWPPCMRDRLDIDSRLNVRLANFGAAHVLNELGFFDGHLRSSTPVPIDIFEIGLRTTMARNPTAIPGSAGYQPFEGQKAAVIPDGYANRRFALLLALVAAARECGATHIGWS